MVAFFEAALRVDQHIGDILNVADFPFSPAHLEQRIVAMGARVGGIEQQYPPMPGTKAGGQFPVLTLNVVNDTAPRPGE